MIQRIKDALNNSFLWLLGLIAAVLYFWKKEKDLETELAENKAEGEVKKDEGKKTEVDGAAADAVGEYERLRDSYSAAELQRRHSGSGQGDPGAEGSNRPS